jgi:hypothetical protein
VGDRVVAPSDVLQGRASKTRQNLLLWLGKYRTGLFGKAVAVFALRERMWANPPETPPK